MTKLNQIIAIEKGVKSRTYSELSELHKGIQRTELFNGLERQYQPKEDDGEKLPSESKKVQLTTQDMMKQLVKVQSDLFAVTARKDYTNMVAKADVKVEDVTIIKDAPVTFLLFLEKQLTDIRTFVATLPNLDESDDWTKDPNSNLYRSKTVETHRTKKIQKPLVLFPATPEHPAQTQLVTEDVIAGFWSSTKLSGAMPKASKQEVLQRVETLLKAVKTAREEANMTPEAKTEDVSQAIFGYLFG